MGAGREARWRRMFEQFGLNEQPLPVLLRVRNFRRTGATCGGKEPASMLVRAAFPLSPKALFCPGWARVWLAWTVPTPRLTRTRAAPAAALTAT